MGGLQADLCGGNPLSACLDRGTDRPGGVALAGKRERREEGHELRAAVAAKLIDDDVVSIREKARAPAAVVLSQDPRAPRAGAWHPRVAKDIGAQAKRLVILLDFLRAQGQDERQLFLSPGAFRLAIGRPRGRSSSTRQTGCQPSGRGGQTPIGQPTQTEAQARGTR